MMPSRHQPADLLRKALASVAGLFLLTFSLLAGEANDATAALGLLVVVLLVSTWAGMAIGVGAAILAALAFNYFFLPPTGTFHIAAPGNWAALAAFLAVALLAGQLVTAARRQTGEALARASEVQALYDLSVDVFAAERAEDALAHSAARAIATTGAAEGGLVLFSKEGDPVTRGWVGAEPEGEVRQRIESLAVHGQVLQFPASAGADFYLPLRVEGEPVGALVARGTRATRGAMESIARLLTLAIEREKLLRDRAHMEALRESEALKTALLRAVSHDLSTPLTALGLQVEGLRRALAGDPASSARIDGLVAELARLRRRIGNLLSLAGLETGSVVPKPEPLPAPDLFRATRESLQLLAAERELRIEVAADCPDVLIDPSLALEILVNLVENAHRASPAGRPVDLVAHPAPGDAGRVRLGVLDRGAGLPQLTHGGDEIDASAVVPRGLGLEIARSFALTSGGSLRLAARPGGGTCAWVDLPAAAGGAA